MNLSLQIILKINPINVHDDCFCMFNNIKMDILRFSACSSFQDRLQAHHAPMDFSAGHGGRIISDPAEAASVSRSSCPRGLRPGWPGGQGSPQMLGSGSKSSLDSASSDRDPGTDLSLSLSLSEATWFKPTMGREQANSALFPYRL